MNVETLYIVNGSIPSMRVLSACSLFEVPIARVERLFVMRDPPETKSAAFLALNPRGETPLLVATATDGERVTLAESFAILMWLARESHALDAVAPRQLQHVFEAESLRKAHAPIEQLFKATPTNIDFLRAAAVAAVER